jgi:hypothetical protein
MLITDEVKRWNNSIVGAYLLWRFTDEYTRNHSSGEAPVALLHFVANAILSTSGLLEEVRDGKGGLASFALKLDEKSKRKADMLATIQDRIIATRVNTLLAIDMATANGLLVWELEACKLHARALKAKPRRGMNVRDSMKRLGNKAGILGKWFSRHDLNAIAKYLRFDF